MTKANMSPETIILMMANGNMANMSIWIVMYFAIKMLLENYPKIKKLSYLLMRKKTNEYMTKYKISDMSVYNKMKETSNDFIKYLKLYFKLYR